MPISRTVNGLIDELRCDDIKTEWDQYAHYGWSYEDDTTDKVEGTASMHYDGSTAGSGWFMSALKKGPLAAHVGDRIHLWHKSGDTKHNWYLNAVCIEKPGCVFGPTKGWPAYTCTIFAGGGAEGWTLKKANIPSCVTGYDDQRYLYYIIGFLDYGSILADWVDHIVTSTTRYLTVTGLTPGQKVQGYRASDNVKIIDATCAGGQTQIVVDLDNEDYPLYAYFKVYATDGTTLIETTPNWRICGGDTWYWVSPYGTLTIETTSFIIIRTGGTGSPTSASITATLLTQAGSPAPNKTIYFTTSRGTVAPGSDVTDSNGQVQTVLTSDSHGIAVVKANWPGDADVPAAVAWATHHVFYNAEVADSTKKFQFYLEGIEYVYVDGAYSLSSETTPQEFSVQIPEWVSTITRKGLISIYRKGVKEFGGILTKVDRLVSESPRFTLSGTDSKTLLETRVVTLKDYSAKSLSFILDELLDSYSCGITLGVVETYPADLTITFSDESLVSTVSRLCDVIGWLYRINADNSLDVKSSFGSSKPSIEFVEGVNLFMTSNTEDLRPVSNSIRMRGKDTLVSTQFDAASIESVGILEEVVFQKSIADQGTLDIAAVAELSRKVGAAIKIAADVLDDYGVASWGVNDWITLTCADAALSGTYKVIKITRDMKDPRVGQAEFANKALVELADIFDRLKRELKDLSAKSI